MRLNLKYQSGSPLLPEKLGDRYYSQDYIRDFNFGLSEAGRIPHILRFPATDRGMLLQSGKVTSSGNNLLTLPGTSALVLADIEIPDSFASFPPTKKTISIRKSIGKIFTTGITDIDLTITGQINNNLLVNPNGDGTTINYVKMRYKEIDSKSRARAKATGTYFYEITETYEWVLDDVAPTGKDARLATFTYDSGTGSIVITQFDHVVTNGNTSEVIQEFNAIAPDYAEKRWSDQGQNPFESDFMTIRVGDGIDKNFNFLDVHDKIIKGILDADQTQPKQILNVRTGEKNVTRGVAIGWNFSVVIGGGSIDEPDELRNTKGTDIIIKELTWVNGFVTVIVHKYDNGTTIVTEGTETITYDAENNVTATTWS